MRTNTTARWAAAEKRGNGGLLPFLCSLMRAWNLHHGNKSPRLSLKELRRRQGGKTSPLFWLTYIVWFALPHNGWLPWRLEDPCPVPFPGHRLGSVRRAPLHGFGAVWPVVSVPRAAPLPSLNPLHAHRPEEQREM